MIHALNEYLLGHKELYLPGVGLLELESGEASFDIIGRVINPPMPQLNLVAVDDAPSLQPLAAFLGRRLAISEEQAFGLYHQFMQLVQRSLDEHGEFVWDPLGKIRTGTGTGTVHAIFETREDLRHARATVVAERVVREGASHTMQVGDKETTTTAMQEWLEQDNEPTVRDRWWIWPLVLGLAAIGLILWRRLGEG